MTVNNMGRWRNIDRKNVREVKQSAIIQIGQLNELFGGAGPTLISGDMPNALSIGSDGKLKVTPVSSGGISDVKLNGSSVVSGGVANVTAAQTSDITSAVNAEALARDQAISNAVSPINTSVTSLTSDLSIVKATVNGINATQYDLKQGQFGSTASEVVITISNMKGTAVQATIPAATAASAGAMSSDQFTAVADLKTRVSALEAGGGGGGGTPTYPPIATTTQAGIVLSDATTPGNVAVSLTGVMSVNNVALQSDIASVQSDIADVRSDIADLDVTQIEGRVDTLENRADAMDSTAAGLQTQIDNLSGSTNEVSLHNADPTAHAALNIPRTAADVGAATPIYVTTAIASHNMSVASHNGIIAPIQAVIPTQATATNQLADKDFVNSSIQNMASNYVTMTAAGDEQWTDLATLQAGPWFHRGVDYTPTNNDYAMVLVGSGPTAEQWRAQFDGSQWNLLYALNVSGLTAAQNAAIDSGITDTLVAQITTNQTDIAQLQTDKTDINQFKASAYGDPAGEIAAVNAMALNGKADTAFAPASHQHDATIVMTQGTLPVQYGGTGLSAQLQGNMRYATSTVSSQMILPPTANVKQVLTHDGTVATVPVWQDTTAFASANGLATQSYVDTQISSGNFASKTYIDDQISSGDFASKAYVSTQIASKAYVSTQIASSGFATQSYVDSQIATVTPEVGAQLDASSKTVINVADPVNDQDAATKKYVDDSIATLKTYIDGRFTQLVEALQTANSPSDFEFV